MEIFNLSRSNFLILMAISGLVLAALACGLTTPIETPEPEEYQPELFEDEVSNELRREILVLALLILASGINTLFSRPGVEDEAATFGRGMLLALGLLTGFGSALTGTGGPVLLIPVLLFMKMPALLAIAAGQVVQIPISAFASLGNGLFGEIDLVLGTILGLIQSLGVVAGARIAHAVNPSQLRRFVALALIGVAFLMIGRLVF